MARLAPVDPDHAPEALATALRAAPPLSIIRTMAHAEGVFRPWLVFAEAVLNRTALDPGLRELAILRVAALSPGADYEWDQHEAIARAVGLGDERIAGARTGEGLTGDDALVARFTEEVVRDVSPSDATWAAVAARFDERQIVELLLVVGHYMLVARVIATAQVDPDPPVGAGLLDDLGRSADR